MGIIVFTFFPLVNLTSINRKMHPIHVNSRMYLLYQSCVAIFADFQQATHTKRSVFFLFLVNTLHKMFILLSCHSFYFLLLLNNFLLFLYPVHLPQKCHIYFSIKSFTYSLSWSYILLVFGEQMCSTSFSGLDFSILL